jgi:hypothetical protein
MATSSVNNNSINTAAYVAPQQDSARQAQEVQAAQTQETQAAQQQSQQSAPPPPQEPRPVVNTQGQTTGRLVNETA